VNNIELMNKKLCRMHVLLCKPGNKLRNKRTDEVSLWLSKARFYDIQLYTEGKCIKDVRENMNTELQKVQDCRTFRGKEYRNAL
jgi:hypothetical protein